MLTRTEESWHRLIINYVTMSCQTRWAFLPRMKYKAQVNVDNLNNRIITDQYKNKLDVKLRSLPKISNSKWKGIAQVINDTEITVLEKKPKYPFHVNNEIARLSK